MSAEEYSKYRWRLAASFALRVLGAGVIIYVWDDLEGFEKIVAIAAAVFVVPGLGTVKKLFRPYERYLRDEELLQVQRHREV
jgi:hypothetical protein